MWKMTLVSLKNVVFSSWNNDFQYFFPMLTYIYILYIFLYDDLYMDCKGNGGRDVPMTLPSGQTPRRSSPGTKYPVLGMSHFDLVWLDWKAAEGFKAKPQPQTKDKCPKDTLNEQEKVLGKKNATNEFRMHTGFRTHNSDILWVWHLISGSASAWWIIVGHLYVQSILGLSSKRWSYPSYLSTKPVLSGG